MSAVAFEQVDVIFGKGPEAATALLDQGLGRDEIQEQTGHVVGVSGATLAVEEAETCVLMGLSGSGKSTLLRCVNRLITATRGKVLVRDGESQVDIPSCDAATLRHLRMNRIAMVFQQFALLPWRTVEDNVGFGLELRGVPKEERDRLVADKLSLVSLDRWKDKYVQELSGGMQQRVGLARAFATDADILLMDEPFSALDPLIREHLQEELMELQRELKKTIIFVSHDLDEALKIGNHIAIMEGGRIVQQGPPEQIVLAPASDYVAQFVANMNPLNVMRGGSLMTPLDKLGREGEAIRLGTEGAFRCRLDDRDRPQSVADGDRECRLIPPDATAAPGDIACVPVDLPMRRAIELRHATGRPLLLVDGDGRLAGVIGEAEILAGLLRQGRKQPVGG